jgi:hypothetical protein
VATALCALVGAQSTGATAGPRFLGRLGSALLELDRWAPGHREDLESIALDRDRTSIEVPDLPLRVTIPANAVLSGDDGDVERALTSATGQRLYDSGRQAFRNDEGAGGGISVTEPVRWAIDILHEDSHNFWRAALAACFIAVVLTAALVALTSPSGGAGILRSFVFGAGAFSVLAAATWFLMLVLGNLASSPVDKELAHIIGDIAWMGLRAGLSVTAGSLLIALLLRLVAQPNARYEEWRQRTIDEAT